MTSMRRMGTLLLKFRSCSEDENLTGEDMLHRSRFPALKDAVNNMCGNNNDLKVAIGYLLKQAVIVMRGVYLINGDDSKATDVDNFLAVLQLHWGHMFRKAASAVELKRQHRLRKPSQLPDENDVCAWLYLTADEDPYY